ncbi:BACON domain-containing protein [Marinifilum fragile]|uniref:BACON domain-containing protein n=1 Tax=Marinifilum fragile TaxID=570161 RepID=UPI002AA613EE|nr:BACON domain-containing protein [Marinifilum fragile]
MAQNSNPIVDVVKISPPPNTASLLELQDIPINYATGQPIIYIELHRIEIGNISIPISLSYNAKGVRVNDISSAVGLGWSLVADGGIYRTINGLADDEITGWINNSNYDYSPSAILSINTQDPSFSEWSRLKNLALNKYDTQPDDFSFSFFGNNGNFKFQYNNSTLNPITINKIKITPIYQNCDMPSDIPTNYYSSALDYSFDRPSDKIISFTAKDYWGNTYDFDQLEANKYYSGSFQDGILTVFSSDDVLAKTYYGVGTTGWKINEINTYDGHKILFEYEDYMIEYSDRIRTSKMETGCPGYDTTPVTQNHGINKLISSISLDDTKTVDFHYSFNNCLDLWQMQLDSIVINDSLQQNEICFKMNYGVFAGVEKRLQLLSIEKSLNNQESLKVYEFEYDNTPLANRNSFVQDYFGFHNNATENGSLILLNPDGSIRSNRSVNASAIETGILKKIKYPTGGYREFSYEPNVDETLVAEGVRVKSIKEQYGEDTADYMEKEFEYFNLKGKYINESNLSKFIKSVPETARSKIDCVGATFYSYEYERTKSERGFYYDSVRVVTLKPVNVFGDTKFPCTTYSYEGFLQDMQYKPLLVNEKQYTKTSSRPQKFTFDIEVNYDLKRMIEYEYLSGVSGVGILTSAKIYDHVATVPKGLFRIGEWTTEFFVTPDYHKYSESDFLLSKKSITDYFENEFVNQVYTYEYNSKALPSKVTNTSSSGKIIQSRMKYSFERYSSMNSKNMIEFPAETIKLVDDQVVNGQKTSYMLKNNTYLVDDIYVLEADIPLNLSNYLSYFKKETDITGYDQYGNVNEYTGKNGVTTSILWDNSGSYPMAAVNGSSYSAISSLNSKDCSYDSKLLWQQLHNLVPEALIATYSYQPLKGMISQTNINGVMSSYSYNKYGFLSQIKNDDGKIVREVDYNYSGRDYSDEGSSSTITLVVSPTNLNFQAIVQSSKEVLITCSDNWTITCSDWLIVDNMSGSGDATIQVTAEYNGTQKIRYGTITVTSGSIVKTVSVSQEYGLPRP